MMWFPAFHQMRWRRNNSWLNSLWLGFIWPIISLPEVLFCNTIAPLMSWSWDWPIRLFWRLWTTVTLFLRFWLYGLCGWVSTENVTMEEMQSRLFIMRLREAMEAGDD